MTRRRLSQLHISSLHLQQGLFASLALLITLIGGQQFQRWDQSHSGQALNIPRVIPMQSHFSSVSRAAPAEAALTQLITVDQVQPDIDLPYQERWVF